MKNKYILSALILGTLSMSTISCSDFLNEELTTKRNTEYLKTEEGVADLSVALYENLRYHFARENSVAFTQFYPSLSKFIDGYRESVTDRVGTRDGILARVGETYLIAAEALVRQGKYQEALGYINTLRDRAAYKQGEDREHHVDGGAAYKSGAPGYKDNGENLLPFSLNLAMSSASSGCQMPPN
jgi:hypothetical protein